MGRRRRPDRSRAPTPPKPSPPPPGKRFRRRVITFVTASIVAVALAAGAVVLLLDRHPKPVLPSLHLDGVDPVLAEAIEESQAAVREAPKSAAAWGKLGQLLYVHAMGGPAVESFARAAELDPADPRWPYLRGRTIARENGDSALPFLRRAAEMVRGSPGAPSLVLAELLLERGELAEAGGQIDLVLARDAADPRAQLDRARLEMARGNWDAARRDLEESIRLAPNVKASHLLLAKVYSRAGGGNDTAGAAERETRKAAALGDNPHWPDPFIEEMAPLAIGRSALLERAEILLHEGKAPPAIAALEALASRYSGDIAVQVTLGQAYLQAGDAAKAESTFRAAIAARSDSVDAQLWLGRALCEGRRFSEALPPLREAVRLNPNLPEPCYELAVALLGSGDRGGAIEALRQAVRVEPSFRKGYVALGTALAAESGGNKPEAASALRRALELDPDDPPTAALLKQLDPTARP
jgi:tetratricopeptide (TPR) repeat protein